MGLKGTVEVSEGVHQVPGADVFVTTLDKLFNWARAGSMWPVTFGLA